MCTAQSEGPVKSPILKVCGERFPLGVHSKDSKILPLKIAKLPNQTIHIGINMDVNPGDCLGFGLIFDANMSLKIDISLDF